MFSKSWWHFGYRERGREGTTLIEVYETRQLSKMAMSWEEAILEANMRFSVLGPRSVTYCKVCKWVPGKNNWTVFQAGAYTPTPQAGPVIAMASLSLG